MDQADGVFVFLARNRKGEDPAAGTGRMHGIDKLNERDEEGIVAAVIPTLGSTPLVRLHDDETLDRMRKLARRVAKERNRRIELVRFTGREHVGWIEP